jgi:hypothetical protein
MDLSDFQHVVKRFKIYSVFVENLAAAAEITKGVNVLVGSPFVVTHLEAFSYQNGTRGTFAPCNILVKDSTGSWDFADRELPIELLSPTGKSQMQFTPHELQEKATISVKVISKHSAALDCYVALWGFHAMKG